MEYLKVTAELSNHFGPPGKVVRIDVKSYGARANASTQYPLELRFPDDACISEFERLFDHMKRCLLEELHKENKEAKFEQEFNNDPEGHIQRALEGPK